MKFHSPLGAGGEGAGGGGYCLSLEVIPNLQSLFRFCLFSLFEKKCGLESKKENDHAN